MLGYYLLAFFVAIIVVVYWAKANDNVPLGGKTTGILRMPFTEKPDAVVPGAASDASPSGPDAPVRETASAARRQPD